MGVGLALGLVCAVFPLTQIQAVAATSGSLSVDRSSAVPGWWLTFSGHAPKSGAQQITLQRFLNGSWGDVKTVKTDSTGAFNFHARQMAMPTEYYRVHGSGFATPQVSVRSIIQNVEITASQNFPVIGQRFTLSATVTPQQQGRVVNFLRAASGGGWDLLGQATTNSNGLATFSVTGPGRYEAIALAYRGACAYPSLVLTLPANSLTNQYVNDTPSSVILSPQPSSNYHSAEWNYSWWPAGENWDWESGQGTNRWTARQAGAGNVSTFVGMLALLSGSYNNTIPSYGTTVTTLANKGHRYGRWEMRTRQKEFGSTTYTPYLLQLRLVRAGTAYRARPANYITIGQWRGFSGRTRLQVTKKGVTNGYTTFGVARNNTNFHNYAVELTRKHLTWLIDGKVIATAPARMLPGGYWVPQFVLRAKSGTRMTATRLVSDWVRYFPLSNKNAKRLPTGPTPTR